LKKGDIKMNGLSVIGIGILLVIMGTVFSLFGNVGSIISFIIAITVVVYIINIIKKEKAHVLTK
jgi:putative flippase GtrA